MWSTVEALNCECVAVCSNVLVVIFLDPSYAGFEVKVDCSVVVGADVITSRAVSSVVVILSTGEYSAPGVVSFNDNSVESCIFLYSSFSPKIGRKSI